jgi:hypothetical protein
MDSLSAAAFNQLRQRMFSKLLFKESATFAIFLTQDRLNRGEMKGCIPDAPTPH